MSVLKVCMSFGGAQTFTEIVLRKSNKQFLGWFEIIRNPFLLKISIREIVLNVLKQKK